VELELGRRNNLVTNDDDFPLHPTQTDIMLDVVWVLARDLEYLYEGPHIIHHALKVGHEDLWDVGHVVQKGEG